MLIAIVVVAYACLGGFHYLSIFANETSVGLPRGIMAFGRLLWATIALDCIYLLGWLWGMPLIVLLFFTSKYFVYPLVALLYRVANPPSASRFLFRDSPSPFIHVAWMVLIAVLCTVSVASLFLTNYGAGRLSIGVFMAGLSPRARLWFWLSFGTAVYLAVGFFMVLRDYGKDNAFFKPKYALDRNIPFSLLMILLWPIRLPVYIKEEWAYGDFLRRR